ncbi:MAG: hypothetical protein WCK98_03855 [bacterium]
MNLKHINSTFLTYSKVVKWFEVLLILVFYTLTFWLLYSNSCINQNCKELAPSTEIFFSIIKVGFIVWGLLNSLRIALVYMAFDRDKEPEILFHTSLAGLTLCFSVVGLFFQEFDEYSRRVIANSGPFLVELVLILTTAIVLLQEKYIWEKANSFVKVRVGLSFLHLILLLVNPFIGLIASLIIFPVMTFWRVSRAK